jgi:hypothetical protein
LAAIGGQGQPKAVTDSVPSERAGGTSGKGAGTNPANVDGRQIPRNPRKIVAVDPKVIEDMRMIARLHDEEGMSFHKIWRSLLYGKVKRLDGQEWAGPSMICRYYHRYKELKKRRVKEVESRG